MHLLEWEQQMKGHTAAVVGLGISNLPLIVFLCRHGLTVTARDRKDASLLDEEYITLAKEGKITLITGEGYLEDLDEDLIFRSPGLRPDLSAFVSAKERGSVLSSEIELFLTLTPARVIGITGSDGKTTTTTLTGLFISEALSRKGMGKCFVGGNIGTPPISFLEEMTEGDLAVLELSSFQLQELPVSPQISAITNLSPNHMDWHRGMEEYVFAKTSIYKSAPNERLILNADDPASMRLAKGLDRPITLFSSTHHSPSEFPSVSGADAYVYVENGSILYSDAAGIRESLDTREILLPGKHNLENYMTAIALTAGVAEAPDYTAVAREFVGVRHRLEPVAAVNGVHYINSSIDSTPTRTAAALSAMKKPPVIICGGYDKKVKFAPLAVSLLQYAKAVILTGATRKMIMDALLAECPGSEIPIPVYTEPDFTDAVCKAREIAEYGDTVLLSPACASFDAFRNFEARGDRFCEIVKEFENIY